MTSSPDRARTHAGAAAGVAGASSRPGLAWAVPDLDPAGVAFTPTAEVVTIDGWMPHDLDLAVRVSQSPSPLEQAYAKGWDDGARDALARAREDLAPTAAMLALLMSTLSDSADQFARDRERNLEALALAVAHRMIEGELRHDPALVQSRIARALELLPLDVEIRVRVHPDDLERVHAVEADLLPEGRTVTLRWIADAAIERGSFLAETPQRMVDGRVDVALRTLYERLGDD